MDFIIIGVLLVFAKTNLQLLDTGVFFYATNALGYGMICLGLWRFADQLPGCAACCLSLQSWLCTVSDLRY